MARSHIVVAFVAAFTAALIFSQLVLDLGFPQASSWHSRLDQSQHDRTKTHMYSAKQNPDVAVDPSQYLIGVGKADITGPVVELNLMGYANSSQLGTGLRQRLYSRAFIVGSPSNTDDRIVYLVLDTQSGDTAIRNGILEGLQSMGSAYAMYTQKNVAVTGTHSHAGPGAWLNYLLPQITSLGFDKQSYQAIVDGALLSIKRAHEGLTEGTISSASGKIDNANINRSLYAYLANPAEERARYTDDVDKTMTLLKFTRASDGKSIGILNWFAVHGTSLLGNQTIVAADNKGVAAYLLEKDVAANADSLNAAPGFVAGFSQANVGDTTPNVNGAWCEDGSGQECKVSDSTCGGRSQDCHGRGPFFGLNDGGVKSCYEIGKRQYNGAKSIFTSSSFTPIAGAVRSFHTFVDYSNFTFTLTNGTTVRTCPAAMGNSFAAGTSDGPGALDFVQNDPGAPNNPFWNIVGSAIAPPGADQISCQQPKPILLNVGQAKVPYDWAPNIVDIQAFRIGQFFIIVSPGEATTMSGRRWREAVYNKAVSSQLVSASTPPIVVLGGPANSYTHYIATEEEYSVQRYEGASTLYGPHTLNAHINNTLNYLPYLADTPQGTGIAPSGPSPPDNRERSISLITGVVYDGSGGKSYGQVATDVSTSYARGAIVKAVFVGANPRNNLRLEGTFTAVEQQSADGSWAQIRNDDDWELVYQWKRINGLTGTSEVTVSWDTGITGPAAGTYRLKYYGDAKAAFGGAITSFTGTSGVFTLT